MELGKIWHELQSSARALRRDLAFTLFAVVLLALGIGANSTMFSTIVIRSSLSPAALTGTVQRIVQELDKG